MTVTRRDFLKLGSAGALGAASLVSIAGAGPTASRSPQPPPPPRTAPVMATT